MGYIQHVEPVEWLDFTGLEKVESPEVARSLWNPEVLVGGVTISVLDFDLRRWLDLDDLVNVYDQGSGGVCHRLVVVCRVLIF